MTSFLHWLHRWMGLTLGLVLVLICLSGTALLFQSQFFRWAHGDLIPAGTSQQQLGSIDTWVKNANAAVPDLHGPFYAWAPQTSHNISDAGMLFYRGEPTGFGKLGYTAVLVAPASGEVLGVVNVDRSLAYAPAFLHGRLWSGRVGILIVALVAVSTVLLLAIGMYLWWPPRERLARKLSARPLRSLLYAGRLHDWAGAWSLVLLLVVAITGVYMARADWFAPALNLLPGDSPHAAHATGHSSGHAPGHAPGAACTGPIGFDQAVTQARGFAPGAALVALESTNHGDPALRSWRLIFKPNDAVAATQETHVLADLQCGTVALTGTPDERAPRDTAEMVLHGLHDGTLLGWPGRIFISLVGLIPLVLAWTGVVRWLRSRRPVKRPSLGGLT